MSSTTNIILDPGIPLLFGEAAKQERELEVLVASSGEFTPGVGTLPLSRKTWMQGLRHHVRMHDLIWPGSHNSASNGIGNVITRPFAECQTLSIYEQLAMGCRVLDVHVQQDRLVCNGSISGYFMEVVFSDIRRFLSEPGSGSEILILEIRTEFGQHDPPDFEKFIISQLGSRLIQQDDQVFHKTIGEMLQLRGRVICVWKPRQAPPPKPGERLWSAGYLRDDWINTDLPKTKFDSNLRLLNQNPPLASRNYFYRVENTLTPGNNILGLQLLPVTSRIHRFARLFISQAKRTGGNLQVFSTDFIDQGFVDACISATVERADPFTE